MNKVLIIAYDFPPAWTSGVYRPLKFAKYLPRFGWKPIILTVKNYSREIVDETLLDELPPEARIIRARSWELVRLEKAIFTRLYKKDVQTSMPPQGGRSGGTSWKATPLSLARRFLFSPLSTFAGNFLYIPDDKTGWVPHAVYKGLRAIRQEKIDVIMSTSPPESAHIVALFLRLITGKPWIADFRDPWTDNLYRLKIPRVRMKYETWLEKTVIRRADIVVHSGSGTAGLSKEKFPGIPPEKHRVITNGFDEGDFAGLSPEEIYEPDRTPYLHLVNIGTMYEQSGFENFLKGFERIISSGRKHNEIRVSFVGHLIPAWRKVLAGQPFKDHVDLLGFKPHKETLRYMMAADVLLLILPVWEDRRASQIIAGKVFELMRAGRPIMMIGREGECSRIVERSGLGKFIPSHDVVRISETLMQFSQQKQKGSLIATPDWDFIRRFERKILTEDLARLLRLAHAEHS